MAKSLNPSPRRNSAANPESAFFALFEDSPLDASTVAGLLHNMMLSLIADCYKKSEYNHPYVSIDVVSQTIQMWLQSDGLGGKLATQITVKDFGRKLLTPALKELKERILELTREEVKKQEDEEELRGSFGDFIKRKSIDNPTIVSVLKDVFRTILRKKYNSDDNFNIIVNPEYGTLEITRKREVVPEGEVEDERYQIDLREARAIANDVEIGETCYEPITIVSLGRRAIMAARQTLLSRVMELEKDKVYKIFSEKIGELVIGEVSQVLKKELVITDDNTGAELILPKTEMIRTDFYRKGDLVKSVVKRVEIKNNTPLVILSRIDDTFLERLLELEVPEIEEGLITIRKIVRAPGERAKVSVESYDERIDPVGACVGMKGSRIHGIVRELRNENIDVINYTQNENLLIQRALTPAKVTKIELDTEARRAAVYLSADEVSKAIGKRGININLASALTDYIIDVYRDGYTQNADFDVELDEFKNEIEAWIIDALKAIGCDTARSVLDLPAEELARRTDLEEETIYEVMQILANEFNS